MAEEGDQMNLDARDSVSHCPHCCRIQEEMYASPSRRYSPSWDDVPDRGCASGRLSESASGRLSESATSNVSRRRNISINSSISSSTGSSMNGSRSSTSSHLHPIHHHRPVSPHLHRLSPQQHHHNHHHANHHHHDHNSPTYQQQQYRPHSTLSNLGYRLRRRLSGAISPSSSSSGAKTKPWILTRDSPLKRGWDMLSFCLAIVFLWHGSLEESKKITSLLLLEILWFASDLFLTFHTEVVIPGSGGSLTLRDPHEIAEHYLAHDFWVDLAISLPWAAVFGVAFARRQKKSGAVRRFFSKIGKGTWGGIIRVKNAIGSKVPRPLRLSSIKRFLKWTEVMEVKRVDGVKHLVQYRSGYHILILVIRTLRRILHLHVFAFGRRMHNILINLSTTPTTTAESMTPRQSDLYRSTMLVEEEFADMNIIKNGGAYGSGGGGAPSPQPQFLQKPVPAVHHPQHHNGGGGNRPSSLTGSITSSSTPSSAFSAPVCLLEA